MIRPNCKEIKIPFPAWGKNMGGIQECCSCGQKTKMGAPGWFLVLLSIFPWVYLFSMQIAGIDIGSKLSSGYKYLKYGQIPFLLLIIPFCILAAKIGLKKVRH